MSDPNAYDDIGRLYTRLRRPDPRIAAQITAALGDARRIVDVGAGAGSYEPAGLAVVAVEPSEVMMRQRPPDAAPVVRATADALPFPAGAFDAAMASLTVHHWPDLAAGLGEMRRVASRLVVFTFEPTVHAAFWLLRDYVPESNALPSARVPPVAVVADMIGADRVETVPVPADCADGFNWAFWNRPHRYLDPEVRACISGLALLPPELVAERMERLHADLVSGAWTDRYGHLLQETSVDGGFRLIVRD